MFLLLCGVASAQPCMENFSSDGNILTGRIYRTWAVAQGVRRLEAFPRVYAFTAANGFTILSADREAGVVSAAQSVSYGNGKKVPLTITLAEEVEGTRIGISYATSGGLHSPEDAIRRHFCLTVAAASDRQRASPAPEPSHGGQPLRGYALATAEQKQAIQFELSRSKQVEAVRDLAEEAMPAVAAFVERLSCLADQGGTSALNEFAVPGTNLANYYLMLRPMRSAPYHSKTSCMSVSRVHGWSAPAKNALLFEVIYKADDSGETAKLQHEAIRQPDGVWLFSR